MKTVMLFAIIPLVLLLGCGQGNNSIEGKLRSQKINNLNRLKSRLINRNVSEFNDLITDTIFSNTTPNIIFYYNGMDCHNCIKKGFQIVNIVNNESSNDNIWIIATDSNINHDQLHYKYENYIYSDPKEIIRRKLKNFYSPVFFIINNNVIVDLFFVSSDEKISDSKE
jgi:hypothetical protein